MSVTSQKIFTFFNDSKKAACVESKVDFYFFAKNIKFVKKHQITTTGANFDTLMLYNLLNQKKNLLIFSYFVEKLNNQFIVLKAHAGEQININTETKKFSYLNLFIQNVRPALQIIETSLYKINFFSTFEEKNLIKNLTTLNITMFLRKTKIFNKGRYSRNRQIYRTGVYLCL